MDADRIAREVGDQVRELLADAKRQADEIVATAEAEAEQLRLEAQEEANQLRSAADESTQQRVDELRRGLDELQSRLRGEQPSGEVIPPQTVPEPAPAPSPVPEPVREPEPGPERVPEPEPPLIPEPTPPPDEGTPPEVDPAPASAKNGDRRPDPAGARLVAMNMALGGSDPAEIKLAIERDFAVEDPGGLVDEVLERAGVSR